VNILPQVKDEDTSLLFIPAGLDPNYATMPRESDQIGILQDLFSELEERHGVDYIIIDSPSGTCSTSIASMMISNLILMFFKSSVQHCRGTIELLNWRIGHGDKPICVRDKTIIIPVMFPSKKDDKATEEYNNNLRSISETMGIEIDEIKRYSIPEIERLRGKEELIVFEKEGTHYEMIANEIIRRSN